MIKLITDGALPDSYNPVAWEVQKSFVLDEQMVQSDYGWSYGD